jgi:hypothetical protein
MKGDFTLAIEHDNNPEPWDDWEHVTNIVHWHRRGFIGESIIGREKEWYAEHKKAGDIIFPLYLYEHSGQSVSLGRDKYPFTDPWDSGQVGFAYIEQSIAKKEWHGKRYWKREAEKCLQAEIRSLDQYLTGDVWGYTIKDNEGEIVDSCWGFYGHEDCEAEGKSQLSYYENKQPSLFSDKVLTSCISS